MEPWPPAIFLYIQIKSELIFGHRCISIRLQRWANLGHQAHNWTDGSTGRTEFCLGHVIKNRDCPGNFGMDGHLRHSGTDVGHISEVTVRRAQLILRWVTVFGWAYHLM